jgi:hypothetical protein
MNMSNQTGGHLKEGILNMELPREIICRSLKTARW